MTILTALVLAVALFAVTRHQHLELSVLGLCARAAEAVVGVVYILPALGMLAVAREGGGDAAAALLGMLTRPAQAAAALRTARLAPAAAGCELFSRREAEAPRYAREDLDQIEGLHLLLHTSAEQRVCKS